MGGVEAGVSGQGRQIQRIPEPGTKGASHSRAIARRRQCDCASSVAGSRSPHPLEDPSESSSGVHSDNVSCRMPFPPLNLCEGIRLAKSRRKQPGPGLGRLHGTLFPKVVGEKHWSASPSSRFQLEQPQLPPLNYGWHAAAPPEPSARPSRREPAHKDRQANTLRGRADEVLRAASTTQPVPRALSSWPISPWLRSLSVILILFCVRSCVRLSRRGGVGLHNIR